MNKNPLDYPIQSPYEILGVSETDPFDKITAVYRKLLLALHPDKQLTSKAKKLGWTKEEKIEAYNNVVDAYREIKENNKKFKFAPQDNVEYNISSDFTNDTQFQDFVRSEPPTVHKSSKPKRQNYVFPNQYQQNLQQNQQFQYQQEPLRGHSPPEVEPQQHLQQQYNQNYIEPRDNSFNSQFPVQNLNPVYNQNAMVQHDWTRRPLTVQDPLRSRYEDDVRKPMYTDNSKSSMSPIAPDRMNMNLFNAKFVERKKKEETLGFIDPYARGYAAFGSSESDRQYIKNNMSRPDIDVTMNPHIVQVNSLVDYAPQEICAAGQFCELGISKIDDFSVVVNGLDCADLMHVYGQNREFWEDTAMRNTDIYNKYNDLTPVDKKMHKQINNRSNELNKKDMAIEKQIQQKKTRDDKMEVMRQMYLNDMNQILPGGS